MTSQEPFRTPAIPAECRGSGMGLVDIALAGEPLRRNWTAMVDLFQRDREALRRIDAAGCAALEMAESMDKFLQSGFDR